MERLYRWLEAYKTYIYAGAWLVCGSAFVLFYPTQGKFAVVVLWFPAIISGWLYGEKIGFWAGTITYPIINLLTFIAEGGLQSWFDPVFFVASIVASMLGLLVGGTSTAMRKKYLDEMERRQHAEIRVQREENKYRTLFEDAPISLWEEDFSDVKKYIDALKAEGIVDFETYFNNHPEEIIKCTQMVRVLDVNRVTYDLFKVAGKDELLQNLGHIFGEESTEVFRQELIAIAKGERVFENRGINYDLEGNILHVDVKWEISPDYEDTLERVLVSIVNITEQVLAEEELTRQKRYFENLFRVSPIAIVTTDANSDISDCNPAFEKLFGYTKSEVLKRQLTEVIIQPVEHQNSSQLADRVRGGDMIHVVTQRRHKNGGLVDVELFAMPIHGGDENASYMALYHDITDLIAARRAAEAAVKAKAEFLANMSHEIRTPLNAVIGMTSLLLDTPLNPEQQEYAATVRNSGDALLGIINAILDFSKIEAGKLELEQQPFSISDVVETSLDLIASNASAKKLEIAYLVESTVPRDLIGDVTRLRQILVNLLGNAIKFTEKGEIITRVALECQEGEECILHFSVQDTGIGIPPDRIEHLFESFTQVDASTTRRYGGTGLGLAISKQLVEIMGGQMWVESELGKGSTFHFTIRAEKAPPRLNNAGQEIGLIENVRVLIVDDNATNRLILIRQSKSWGMEPFAAASGDEALTWIRNGEKFDLAIIDMQMPEMDGVMLAQEIKQQYQGTIPLILLTSFGGMEDIPAQIKFAARMSKPVKPSLLYNAIAEIMNQRDDHAISAQPIESKKNDVFDENMGVEYPLHILLAEDNLINQKVATRILARLGYRVDIASNGIEVLQALIRQKYDVVLMDIQMPEMDGVEATRHIYQKYSDAERPRIIAMTAHALDGDRERYLGVGMDDYVSKPVRVDELVRALKRCKPHTPAETR